MNYRSGLFSLCCLFTLLLQGQDHTLKLTLGPSITDMTTSLINPASDLGDLTHWGSSAELTYQRFLEESFYLAVGLGFADKGYKARVVLTDLTGLELGIDTRAFNTQYFTLPIQVGLQVGDDLYFLANFSLVPAYLIRATTTSELFPLNSNVRITDQVDKFDLSQRTQVGVGKNLTEFLSIDLSGALQHSILGVSQDSQEFSNLYHLEMKLLVGVSLQL